MVVRNAKHSRVCVDWFTENRAAVRVVPGNLLLFFVVSCYYYCVIIHTLCRWLYKQVYLHALKCVSMYLLRQQWYVSSLPSGVFLNFLYNWMYFQASSLRAALTLRRTAVLASSSRQLSSRKKVEEETVGLGRLSAAKVNNVFDAKDTVGWFCLFFLLSHMYPLRSLELDYLID